MIRQANVLKVMRCYLENDERIFRLVSRCTVRLSLWYRRRNRHQPIAMEAWQHNAAWLSRRT